MNHRRHFFHHPRSPVPISGPGGGPVAGWPSVLGGGWLGRLTCLVFDLLRATPRRLLRVSGFARHPHSLRPTHLFDDRIFLLSARPSVRSSTRPWCSSNRRPKINFQRWRWAALPAVDPSSCSRGADPFCCGAVHTVHSCPCACRRIPHHPSIRLQCSTTSPEWASSIRLISFRFKNWPTNGPQLASMTLRLRCRSAIGDNGHIWKTLAVWTLISSRGGPFAKSRKTSTNPSHECRVPVDGHVHVAERFRYVNVLGRRMASTPLSHLPPFSLR